MKERDQAIMEKVRAKQIRLKDGVYVITSCRGCVFRESKPGLGYTYNVCTLLENKLIPMRICYVEAFGMLEDCRLEDYDVSGRGEINLPTIF